ncbi:Bromodomain Adjacent To Zinc Finger Domain Protein 2B [Manis pentadactyla]|nr:Bromodomain Adjacent To Zinc Finger Domain Protein 2B [Manis pentadactyla]
MRLRLGIRAYVSLKLLGLAGCGPGQVVSQLIVEFGIQNKQLQTEIAQQLYEPRYDRCLASPKPGLETWNRKMASSFYKAARPRSCFCVNAKFYYEVTDHHNQTTQPGVSQLIVEFGIQDKQLQGKWPDKQQARSAFLQLKTIPMLFPKENNEQTSRVVKW